MSQSSAVPLDLGQYDPWTTRVRNDYHKALHGSLLRAVGVEGTRQFWAQTPLIREGRALGEQELAEHVWNETALSPVAWTMALVNSLEPFLIERGVRYASFVERTRRHANRGSFVQVRHLLAWLGPILVPMFRFGDPYRLLLQGVGLVSKRMASDVTFRMLRSPGSGSSAERQWGSLWLSFAGLERGEIPAWDFSMQPGADMLEAPRIFGLPPFDEIVPVCDARSATGIPWGDDCAISDGRLVIGGETYGRVVGFQQFLTDAGYELALIDAGARQVVVVDRDYFCARRERVVLRAGCAYGAPGYLVRLGWRRARPKVKKFLWFAHGELEQEPQPDGAELEQLQLEYLTAVSARLLVRYFESDARIEVGGRPVCRGIPARILRRCVELAVTEGRRDFSFRELKRVPELLSHAQDTGFETRLQRLRSALDRADCGLELELTGRGRFTLVCTSELKLEERP